MKYTTPEIAVESIETKDVITLSVGDYGISRNEIIVDGKVVGQEVVIPDVSILL
jgi:hypothetical protein